MAVFRNLFQSFCTTTSLSTRIILTRDSHFNSFSYYTHTCGELRTSHEHKETIKSLQVESVVLVNGLVSQRPENNINKAMSTGDIEVQLHSLTVLNEADSKLPFLPLSKAYEETQLNGLHSGCPPHGGIALGLDRLIAIICGAQSIHEVIAFPKSYYGRDLLGGAPAILRSDDLSVYGLTLTKK